MKTLLATIFLAGSIFASPFTTYTNQLAFEAAANISPTTFIVTGAASPIPGGYFLNLVNAEPIFATTAVFTSPNPLNAFAGIFDNLPNQVGTGFNVYADGVKPSTPPDAREVTSEQ